MGCAASRSCATVLTGSSRDRHGDRSSSAATPDRCSGARSLPSHLVHHPPLKKGDTYHLVSLTSTTYGSLFLVEDKSPIHHEPPPAAAKATVEEEEVSVGPLPESVINTWELMDGLEEDSDSSHTDCATLSKPVSSDDKIVLYFTSLRGIRKTFEDCCFVRMTLRGFRVPIDERDISMDFSYKKELEKTGLSASAALPQVFIRGKHIGGADQVKQLNECGELCKLLSGFPFKDYRVVCGQCGDARFVMCHTCSGSRKVFDKKEGRRRRCLACNENGLTKCHICC